MRLRIEIVRDSESENWSFRVPSLGIVGGAESREGAEREALEAVAYTLAAHDTASQPEGAEVRYLYLDLSTVPVARESA